jgi:hypothetical protein
MSSDTPGKSMWLAMKMSAAAAMDLARTRLDLKFVRAVPTAASTSLLVVRLTRAARPGGVKRLVGDACVHVRHATLIDFNAAPADLTWGVQPKNGRPVRADCAAPDSAAPVRADSAAPVRAAPAPRTQPVPQPSGDQPHVRWLML